MVLYNVMKKLIVDEIDMLNRGEIDATTYDGWVSETQTKLDVFYARNRITPEQYAELSDLFTKNNNRADEQVTDTDKS